MEGGRWQKPIADTVQQPSAISEPGFREFGTGNSPMIPHSARCIQILQSLYMDDLVAFLKMILGFLSEKILPLSNHFFFLSIHLGDKKAASGKSSPLSIDKSTHLISKWRRISFQKKRAKVI